ncbi:hypothetical protein C0989_004155 [Termitomyces sp. Mn162]|nr:hypothetical protein C0989_004155 [Termitomyces sp. Mn162]
MKHNNLKLVLEGLKSTKISERRDALVDLKTIFERRDFVNNFNVDENGHFEPRAWLSVFQALFESVKIEKIAATKKDSGKSSGTSAAAQRRLEETAGIVRWLTERTVHVLNKRIMKPIFAHLLQTSVHGRELLAPVALHYIKALRCIVGHAPHLDHLEYADWVRMVEIGFNCLLEDPIGHRFEDDADLLQDVNDSELFEEDSDDDNLSVSPGKRSRGETPSMTQSRTQRSFKRARSTPFQVSVTHEQVECMSLISILLGSSSSPLLSAEYTYLPSSILTRFRRFLDRYSGDTSLLHDYVVALASTLSHLSLNSTLEVTKFALGSWDGLLELWGTRNKRIKEGLVSILRMLFPFVTSENEIFRLTATTVDLADGLRRLTSVLDGDTDSRRGVDGLSLECLRLETVDNSQQQLNSAFMAKSFRYGWNFDGSQALAWAILELQADCIAKLFQLSESMQPPPTSGPSNNDKKRSRKEDPIVSLLMSIQNQSPSNVRSYHLQILLFIIDRHWLVFHRELQNDIMNVLLQFVSLDDGVVQSWVFLCFAAIAAAIDPSSGVAEATWDVIWTNAIRRANVPTVSRAACHAAYSILLHTRAYAQKNHSLQIPLASNRILFEIETLAKELDVQGPPYPYDSVCAFLATCLRVASQDMHLYRMQLEEKVLSWLVDCWQIAGFRDKSLPPHLVKDLLMLFESISGFPLPINLPFRIPLPEGQIVDTLVNEARTRVIQDYILEARLPEFKSATDKDRSVIMPLASSSEDNPNSFVQPRGRERRISAFLLKTLERMQSQLDDQSMHPTAESARHSLDMAVTAVCYDSVLVLNAMQSDRRLVRCTCKVISTVIALLPDLRWTTSERALISFGLDPLTFLEDSSESKLAWTAMVPPDIGSGIKSQLLSQLKSPRTNDNASWSRSHLNLLRILWQNADVQSTFNSVGDTMREVLRIALGAKPRSPAHAMDADDHDGFGPIRMATEQLSKDDATVELISNCFTMDICVSFLTVGPALQSTSGEPTRDKQLVDDVLDCAKSRPEAFLSVLPIVLGRSQQNFLNISVKGLDSLLNELSGILPLYQFSRSDRLQYVVIQFLESTLEVWASANVAIGDTLDKIRDLCHWLSNMLAKGKIRSWGVRDLFARFIDRYLTQDPSEQAWDGPIEDLTPSFLLPTMSQDDDIRVRFRVAVKTAGLFTFTRYTVPKRTTSEVYLAIKNKLTIELSNREHMLTRILALGNSMIVASETRRGAYWHLLETCLHSQDYSAHIETVLRSVSQRLGLINFSSMFENYASQLAMSLLQVKKDFLLFPPYVLGYHDRKECVSANFRSFAPVNIWNGGLATFENHCKIASLSTEDGFRDCFGNIIGYEIVSWIDRPDPEGNDLIQLLKVIPLPDEEFDQCLAQNVDDIVASILRSLRDMDTKSIGDALVQDDPSGRSADVFDHLVRYRTDIMETHRPNLPAFPTETILRALRWLRSQVPDMDEKAVSYHIIHHLLADLDRSPFINEQFRLVNSICLWTAMHSPAFIEITLLYTLMHGATSLLRQVDLSRSAQSILDWAFACYRKAKTKHPHVPDILVRIACIAYDLSRTTSDPNITSLGTDLLQWIDIQTFELSKVPSLSSQVMKALPAWPHHPSPQLAQVLQSITGEHLSSVLDDYRISSSKFRLVRRLREHALVGEFDKDHFANVDFWRLKEHIPPSDQLQDADLDAFAALLYLSKGQLGGFRNEPSGSTSILGRYRRKVSREKEGTRTTPQEPIILMLLAMLQGDHPSRSNTAYETLRLIKSAETDDLSHALQVSLSENKVELDYLGRYRRPPLGQVSRELTDLVTHQSYLDSVVNFPRWIADVTTLFSEVLSSKDAFYAQLVPILRSDTEFAEQVLPILVHIILATENKELASQETIGQARYRNTISNFFTSVLSDKLSSIQCLRCVIDAVLHLRHFDRDQVSTTKAKVAKDALSYNKWLSIDFGLLARRSITCGAYTTALLFLELAAEEDAVSSNTSNEILYEIYRHIDEPDGFYAIHDSDLHQNLIKRFHHEKQWERAFRFHGAALEARDTTGHAEGLVESFHSFGFDHLANDVLRTAFSSGGAKKDGLSHDISYRLAWRTETWDLPESPEKSTGASIYLALRAIYRERDVRVIDHTIRKCLFTEVDRLRTLGLEDFAEIRDVIQDVMCLHEIAKWRTNTIQTSLAARDLAKGNWNDFLQIEDDFDFPILENILATRISLVRSVRLKEERQRIGTLVTPFNQSLIDVETQCLVRLSRAARAANEVQVALNSIIRAVGLENPPSFNVFEEFANVLWCQKEEKIAVEYLGRLFVAGQGPYVRDEIEERRKALVLAQLGSWSSAACLKNPEDIQRDYFGAATGLLNSEALSSNPEFHNAHATVYHQYAIFAERQYYDIVKSPDAIRWKIYVERKQREIESLDEEIDSLHEKDRYRAQLKYRRDQAQKMKDADAESFQRHKSALDGFLNQAIDMYSRCLRNSDTYDHDVPIRLCSLWFAHFEENRGNFQTVVGNALRRVPSRKFVFLSHQLSARISRPPLGPLTHAQLNLQSLVLRMCREHPFHILYQVYCLQPEEPWNTRHSGQQISIHAERAEAALYIFNRLRKDAAVSQRLMDVERFSAACLQWAKHPVPVPASKNFALPREFKLSRISNLRVPVITHHTPVDPSMRYDDCPWIDRYDTLWSNAGGKNAPKIGYCLGTDGFKGQGTDDLRQDAVMEQVFNLVNGILHRDRETRRRLLNVREYKVIPLASQGGILEFVENTHAIRDWLVKAHQRLVFSSLASCRSSYHPREKPSSRLMSEINNIRKDKDNPRPLRERLIQNWAKIEENVKPVMRHFFTEKHKTPNSWFATRLDYSRSVATSSIVGHILGLGDRHISNILIDNVTGEVIPIDLGIAFDQGKLLGVPELVPFRLTRDMVDGMGTSGTAGVFQRCAEETLRVLRDGSEVIMTVLEVFKHDPLHSWTASETRIQRVQEGATTSTTTTTTTTTTTAVRYGVDIGIDMSSGSAEEAADRALSSVSRKLDKSLSVQTVVSQLVREATDPINLALMFEGECPSPPAQNRS